MAELALLTGLRQKDIRVLRLDQLGDEGIDVTPSKTANNTQARLLFQWTPALRACIARAKLLRRKPSSPYLFVTRLGQPYTVDGFQTVWKKHLHACGITGMTFHDLRRTAINAVKDARGLEAARAFAAHGSDRTTQGYLNNVGAALVRPVR